MFLLNEGALIKHSSKLLFFFLYEMKNIDDKIIKMIILEILIFKLGEV